MTVAYPDDALTYRPFPIDPDKGFPQTFRFVIEGLAYRATVGVTWRDPKSILESDGSLLLDLPDGQTGVALTLRIDSDDGRSSPLIAVRRVVLDRPLAYGPLRIRFKRLSIALQNLRDPGAAGSLAVAEIAVAG